MTEEVHNVTTVKKSWKPRKPSRKTVAKWTSIAVFGGALAAVGYDKLSHRTSKKTHTVTETEETTES